MLSTKTNSDASLSAMRQRLQQLQKEVSDKQETVDILSGEAAKAEVDSSSL